MNFSSISETSLIGKILRWPLRFIPEDFRMPIWQGKLRGKTWIVGSGTHGYWLGSYESQKINLFQKFVHPGDVVYDIGAHAGYYTLLASKLTGPNGKVIAFEPQPRNLDFLKQHLRLNNISNVLVIEAAVYNRAGTTRFSDQNGSFVGHISEIGNLEVKSVCLDDLWKHADLPAPQVVKIDVEGAEYAVLTGGSDLFQTEHPVFFLATHGSEVNRQCEAWLQDAGYTWSIINDPNEIVALPSA